MSFYFDFRNNQIETLENANFLACVGDFILRSNKISSKSIENLQFNEMTRLVSLQMGNNELVRIPSKTCDAENLNEIHIEGNKIRSFRELGNLKRCVTLKRVVTSLKEVPCSCDTIGRVNNKTLPLKLSSHLASHSVSRKWSSNSQDVKCSRESKLPNSVGIVVQKISSRLISDQCKFSSSLRNFAVFMLQPCCFIMRSTFLY